MKQLLAEYIKTLMEIDDSLSIDEAPIPKEDLGKKITYTDRRGTERSSTIKTIQKKGSAHPAWSQYQDYLSGLEADGGDSAPEKKPEEEPKDGETPKDGEKEKPAIDTDAALKTKEVDVSIDPVREFNDNETFTADGVSDEDYENDPKIEETSSKIDVGVLEKIFADKNGNYRFPKKYVRALARILNSKKGKQQISSYTDVMGAGTPSSQAGELFALMLATVESDRDVAELVSALNEHIKSLPKKERPILEPDWIASAVKVRKALHRRYDALYGEGNWSIDGVAWDVEAEAEALGFVGYKENKGYSTDMTTRLTVRTPDGKTKAVINEVSLKKDLKTNLLNASSARVEDIVMRGFASEEDLEEYHAINSSLDSMGSKSRLKGAERSEYETLEKRREELLEKYRINIPDEARVDRVKQRQDDLHMEFIDSEEGVKELNALLELWKNATPEEKAEIALQNARDMTQTIKGGKSSHADKMRTLLDELAEEAPLSGPEDYKRVLSTKQWSVTESVRKFNMSVMRAIATNIGDNGPEARRIVDAITNNSHEHSGAVLSFLMNDQRAQIGLVSSIEDEFPLKSLLEGEETMVLGDAIADSNVLKEIFGTDDMSEIQRSLALRKEPPPPSIIYRTQVGGREIPIAKIDSRPDGIGYGVYWRLDMKIHPEFGRRLQEATKRIYGT